MRNPPQARIAWSITLATLILTGIAMTLLPFNIAENDPRFDAAPADLPLAFVTLIFAGTGFLVATRQPRNVIGWLLAIIGALFGLSMLVSQYAAFALLVRDGSWPGGLQAAWLNSWLGIIPFYLTATAFLLLFPDGRLIHPRLAYILWLTAALVTGFSLNVALKPGELIWPFDFLDNPYGVGLFRTDVLQIVCGLGLGACFVISAASFVVRVAKSQGIARQQLKWVAFAACFAPVMWMIGTAISLSEATSIYVSSAFVVIGFSALPIAAAAAILRYRLYDIDWVINRTLVYVPLTAVLAGAFVAVTGALRTVLSDETGANSDLAVAIGTIAVVGMLTPVKNYLQERVDRHFKENRDPAGQIKKLVKDTRSSIELLDAGRFIARYLEQTCRILDTHKAWITLYTGEGTQTVAHGEAEGAELVLALRHEGQNLGFLAIGPRQSGRAYTKSEDEALAESADVIADLISLSMLPKSPRAYV